MLTTIRSRRYLLLVRPTFGHRPARGAAVWLPLLLLCLPAAPVQCADGNTGREAMADAMSRMMEAMGLMGAGTDAARSMANGGVPGMPLGQAGEAGRRLLDGMSQAVPGVGQVPWAAGLLEGVWEAAGGGLLIVQGGNYRLYAPNWAYVEGTIATNGNRVQMASRRAGFDLSFEYALDQGRLALRDAGGQVLLYRRLVLNGGN
jgi:hypothetical protein